MNKSGNNNFKNLSGMSLLGLLTLTASISTGGLLLAGCGGGGGGHAGGSGSINEPPPPPPPPQTTFTIDIDAPSEVTYGVPSTFSVIPADAAGAITYSLESAPQGMTIDSATGVISWTPSGLRFSSYTDYTFTVSATDGVETTSDTATVTVNAGLSVAPVVRSSAKGPTTHNSTFIADFDGDSENEIITTDNKNLVYTLKWSSADSKYVQSWVNPYGLGDGSAINAIAVGDVNGDSRVDIAVLNGGTVSVIDGLQQRVLYTASLAETTGKAIAVADLDANGVNEIVAFVSAGSSEKVYVLNAPSSGNTLVEAWSTEAGDYGNAMAVGNVDADSQLEIVLQKATVIDSSTHANQWTGSPNSNFGDIIQIANLNAADENEIIGLWADSPFIVVYSAAVNSDLIGRNNPSNDPETKMCALWAGDLSDDGTTVADNGFAEIVVGICAADGGLPGASGQIEYLQVLNIENLGTATAAFKVKQSVYRPAPATDAEARLHGGFMSFAVGDTDNDSVSELVWSNQFSGTDFDTYDSFSFVEVNATDIANVLEHDSDGLVVEAQTKELGLVEGAFIGALDMSIGGGNRIGMFGSYSSPAEGDPDANKFGDHLVEFNFDTLQFSVDPLLVGRSTDQRSMFALKAADVEGLGYDQVVASVSDFDFNDDAFSTFLVVNTVTVSGFYLPGILGPQLNGPVALTDINLDGHEDAIGVIDSQLFSFDIFASGNELWRSIPLFDDSVDIEAVNLDADDETELLVLTKTLLEIRDRRAGAVASEDALFSNIFLFSASVSGSNLSAVAAMDIDDDNTTEIYVSDSSDSSSTISVVAKDGEEFGSIDIGGEVTDLLADNTNGQLLVAWSVAAVGDAPRLTYISAYDGDPATDTWAESWRSPAINGKVMPNSMNFTADGKLLIGTESAIYLVQ